MLVLHVIGVALFVCLLREGGKERREERSVKVTHFSCSLQINHAASPSLFHINL